jgi:hypothetical protein
MTPPLTIAYVTGRKDPRAEWFFASLARETGDDITSLQVVVVDFYAQAQRDGEGWDANDAFKRRAAYRQMCTVPDLVVSAPCGNVWQGPHRLTRDNFFAKSNTLNTAIMLAKHDWIAVADDLSHLVPGWLACVREAQRSNYIMCGAYEKRKDVVIDGAQLVSSTEHPPGKDHRRGYAPLNLPVTCPGGWMYGCSFAAPIEALLKVNGFPTDCDSMGYEDSVMGKTIAKHGYRFMYDPRALTIESEELHHVGSPMRRVDPGVSPKDKSHSMLQMYANVDRFDNYYGPEGLRGVRERVLRGEDIPIIRIPDREWFTGQLLSEFGIDVPAIDTRT